MKRISSLKIHQAHLDQMQAEVLLQDPEEACGILGGKDCESAAVYPAENILHSPTRFRMDASRQLEIFLALEDADLDLMAIYHSHPAGPGYPSATDIAEAYYPEAASLIWSPEGSNWRCRAYLIEGNSVSEIPILVIAGTKDHG